MPNGLTELVVGGNVGPQKGLLLLLLRLRAAIRAVTETQLVSNLLVHLDGIIIGGLVRS